MKTADAREIRPTDAPTKEETLSEIQVTATPAENTPTEKTGAYTASDSNSATGLNLPLHETPQSVTVVTRAKMDDFRQENANAALAGTTGVTVEKVETDRTYYTARGFDIVNFQYDGIGMPFPFGLADGDIDTAIYDHIDIVRGADGLTSSTGNPSATVNFVRKRPTYPFQASATLTLGSWETHRLDADVSGALNATGTLAGRFVAAKEAGNSYLDRYSPDKTVFYGVVEANLDDNTLLTVGHARQENRPAGSMWGALPLYDSDGNPTDYPASTSTAADWASWNTRDDKTFAELSHRFGNGWQVKATANHNRVVENTHLFYVYGTPDHSTGLGLYSYPSAYDDTEKQDLLGVYANGTFSMGGREHEIMFGANWARSQINELSLYGNDIGTPLPDLATWDGRYPEPVFNISSDSDYSDISERRRTAYMAARFHLGENLKLITGANMIRTDTSGVSYGADAAKSLGKTTPYVGATYRIDPALSAYGSVTEIFNPQSETDINGTALAPIKGRSEELGIKRESSDRKLGLSAAVFRVRQDNAAEQAGYVGARAYYRGIDAESRGVEVELSGELSRGWHATMGYTQLRITGENGEDVRLYVPRKLLRLATTYQLRSLAALKLGASLNWQDDTSRDQGNGIVTRQPGYALLNLMARYDLGKSFSVAFNLNNVGNRKYLTSLYWDQAYYGAPRNGSVTLSWKH